MVTTHTRDTLQSQTTSRTYCIAVFCKPLKPTLLASSPQSVEPWPAPRFPSRPWSGCRARVSRPGQCSRSAPGTPSCSPTALSSCISLRREGGRAGGGGGGRAYNGLKTGGDRHIGRPVCSQGEVQGEGGVSMVWLGGEQQNVSRAPTGPGY